MQPEQERAIRWQAMELLARREHARKELATKLAHKFPELDDQIQRVLDGLERDNLLSDHRYSEAYCAMRERKGFGPVRIVQELVSKGVDKGLARGVVGESEVDWFASAYRVGCKKCPASGSLSVPELSKLARYLQYRGFDYEHIQAALEQVQEQTC